MASPPPPQSQQQQQDQQQRSDDQLVAAIAGILIIGASAALTTAGIAKVTGIGENAVKAALDACGGHPVSMPRPTAANTAYAAAKTANRMFRAAFVLNAARRIAKGLKAGQPLKDLIDHEQMLWHLHQSATSRRLLMAKGVDAAAQQWGTPSPAGTLLGWYALIDGRTDGSCIAANGTNFYAEVPPMIGYPGSVHPHCRCRPGPAHVGAKMTYSASAVRRGPDSTSFYAGGIR